MRWCQPAMLGFTLIVGLGQAAAQDEASTPTEPKSPTHGTGYIPTPPELIPRFPQTRAYRGFLPTFIDLQRHFPPPGDQGEQNSCVAWAIGYAARGYYSSAAEGLPVTQTNVPSPAYIYDLDLSRRNVADCGSGMMISDALNILERGSASFAQMPYNSRSCGAPSAAIVKLANQFRIRSWKYVNPRNLDTIKGELAKGHPVIFGMKVSEDFIRHRGKGIYHGSSKEVFNSPLGHAMTVVGYEEARQAFHVINSWGLGWGNNGYGWIDYDTFRAYVPEAFAMRPRGRDPVPTHAPKPEPTPPRPVTPTSPEVEVWPPPPSPAPEPRPTPPVPATVVQDLGLQCAKVTLAKEGDKQVARGFVANLEDVARVQEKLKDRAAEVALDVRPWPQCETLLTLDQALAANDRPAVAVRGGPKTLKKGDPVVIEVVSPHGPSQLHVAYIQADGSVVHLVQSDAKNLQTVDSGRRLVFGDGLEGRQRFVVNPPFGAELIIALASRAPLFPEPRPQSETERDFLTALRKALLWKPDTSAPDREVSAAIVAIVTTEK